MSVNSIGSGKNDGENQDDKNTPNQILQKPVLRQRGLEAKVFGPSGSENCSVMISGKNSTDSAKNIYKKKHFKVNGGKQKKGKSKPETESVFPHLSCPGPPPRVVCCLMGLSS